MERLAAGLAAAACFLVVGNASAVRPFITDDARVVGHGNAQLETWARYDKGTFQHWIVPAIGPVDWLEATIGAVHGVALDPDRRYSLAAPLLQTKILFHEARPDSSPGVALILGTFLPFGFGGFESPPNAFAYLAATQVIGNDDLLIHANVGIAGARMDEPATDTPQELAKHDRIRGSWGVATQIHLYRAANLALEVFSGDPYAEVSGGAAQGGLRFSVTPNMQIDASAGGGVWGGDARMPFWASTGLRIVRPGVF